jgi:hypothetical protein
MFQECRHIKPNGSKCHSPAMQDKPYCYYHIRMRRLSKVSTAPFESKAMEVPFLEDRGAVQIALSEVVSALAEHRIDYKRASLMIYALQVASANAKNPNDLIAANQVRETSQNEEGEELGPEESGYEDAEESHEHGKSLFFDLLRDMRELEAQREAEAAGKNMPAAPESYR